MKLLQLLIIFSFILVSCNKRETIQKVGVIPQPNSISYSEGTFLITDKTTIVVTNSKEAYDIAGVLQTFINSNFGLNLNISTEEV